MATPPTAGSLYVVDTFNARSKAAHGDNVVRAARDQGFNGTIVEQKKSAQVQLDPALSQPGIPADTYQKTLESDMLNVQLTTLRNATGELRQLQQAGVHHSAVNFSSGMSKASMVDQYYKKMELAWDRRGLENIEVEKRDAAVADAERMLDNFARGHKTTGESLLNLPDDVREKRIKSVLAQHVDRAWGRGGEASQTARQEYREAVVDLEKNHNSVVVAAENSGHVKSTGAKDFYDNVLSNDQTTNVGALTNDGRQVEAYSNPGKDVDVYARGSSPKAANPGTSYAAPRVAAALARAHQLNAQMSSEEAERLVVDQLATDVGGGARGLDPRKTSEHFAR